MRHINFFWGPEWASGMAAQKKKLGFKYLKMERMPTILGVNFGHHFWGRPETMEKIRGKNSEEEFAGRIRRGICWQFPLRIRQPVVEIRSPFAHISRFRRARPPRRCLRGGSRFMTLGNVCGVCILEWPRGWVGWLRSHPGKPNQRKASS